MVQLTEQYLKLSLQSEVFSINERSLSVIIGFLHGYVEYCYAVGHGLR